MNITVLHWRLFRHTFSLKVPQREAVAPLLKHRTLRLKKIKKVARGYTVLSGSFYHTDPQIPPVAHGVPYLGCFLKGQKPMVHKCPLHRSPWERTQRM